MISSVLLSLKYWSSLQVCAMQTSQGTKVTSINMLLHFLRGGGVIETHPRLIWMPFLWRPLFTVAQVLSRGPSTSGECEPWAPPWYRTTTNASFACFKNKDERSRVSWALLKVKLEMLWCLKVGWGGVERGVQDSPGRGMLCFPLPRFVRRPFAQQCFGFSGGLSSLF